LRSSFACPALRWAYPDGSTTHMNHSRPTSPFWIYSSRFTVFNPSIIHRYTAFALVAGLIALVYFLWSVAAGPQSYLQARALFSNPAFPILVFALVWSFCFHLLNGVRHLTLDAGYGFGKKSARRSGSYMLIGATILAILVCWVAWRH
jgi:succinate dehydrogenase / fumarate reductase cytochrome b subunit